LIKLKVLVLHILTRFSSPWGGEDKLYFRDNFGEWEMESGGDEEARGKGERGKGKIKSFTPYPFPFYLPVD
jgi:hypothetical protein